MGFNHMMQKRKTNGKQQQKYFNVEVFNFWVDQERNLALKIQNYSLILSNVCLEFTVVYSKLK